MRKTTISLPDGMLEALRIRAIKRGTTMSALIQEAVEAYHFKAPRPASLEAFFRPDPATAASWAVGVDSEQSEDFDDADVD